MPSAPEVSVVIPTRSRWPLLSLSLSGALRQEDVDHEVIVVDDGSTDETPERLAGLKESRLRVVRHDRSRGVSAARNRGIAEARGEWVAFLDDDDLWSPRKLRTQLDAARSHDASFVYAAGVVLDERREVIAAEPAPDPAELPRLLVAHNVVPGGCSSTMARTELVRRLGGFDERLSMFADWDLWLKLIEADGVAACHEPLVGYLEHSQSMHLRDLDRVMGEAEYLTAKHRPAAARLGAEFDRIAFSRWVAVGHRRAGQRAKAARVYLRSALTYRNLGNLLRAAWVLVDPRATGIDTGPPRGPTAGQEPEWLALYRGAAGADADH
jgi:glycosyltransferase involved in cell wall biosynthesis